jgi:hypothetical protein
MRLDKSGPHAKTDLRGHLIWIPKYLKRVLGGSVAIFPCLKKQFWGRHLCLWVNTK